MAAMSSLAREAGPKLQSETEGNIVAPETPDPRRDRQGHESRGPEGPGSRGNIALRDAPPSCPLYSFRVQQAGKR